MLIEAISLSTIWFVLLIGCVFLIIMFDNTLSNICNVWKFQNNLTWCSAGFKTDAALGPFKYATPTPVNT